MCLAAPAKIKYIDKDSAIVDFGGLTKKVSLGIASGIKIGDYVLVHAGFVIGKVEQKEAESTLKILGELKKVLEDA